MPFSLADYLELVDWTGRSQRPGKRGFIDRDRPTIMQRLNLQVEAWCQAMQAGGNVFGRAIGRVDHLRLHAQMIKQSWIRGTGRAEKIFA